MFVKWIHKELGDDLIPVSAAFSFAATSLPTWQVSFKKGKESTIFMFYVLMI